MILQLTASADTYITNKIINNSFSASDANVGRAGTIDIFKLYNESTLTGTTNPIELSRGLIKFDYSPLQALTSSKLDFTSDSFKAELLMFDVIGGQAVPENFTLSVFPLAKAFDEGNGRDVVAFRDIDVANFYTASYTSSPTVWDGPGANASGSSSDTAVDYFASGNVAGSISTLNFERKQLFEGPEDLRIDITPLVSASLAGQIENYGLRLSFTGSEETDSRTRFVKRFGSRHARNVFLRPLLRVSFDDSLQDQHRDFYFDLSGSIFLNSFERGVLANIKSGSSLTPITGQSSLNLELVSGSYTKTVTAGQHKVPGSLDLFQTGFYSASFALYSGDTSIVSGTTTIADYVRSSGSITFDTYWKSLDGTVAFHTGSLEVRKPQRFSFDAVPKDLRAKITNLRPEYQRDSVVSLSVFLMDYNERPAAGKFSIEKRSVYVDQAYYRVIDVLTGKVIVPFMQSNNGTRLSADSEGLYFDFDMSALHPGRTYRFEFKVIDSGDIQVLQTPSVFEVV